MRFNRLAGAVFFTVVLAAHSHEPSGPSNASDLGPVRGKTVRVTQAEIDLMMAAQSDIRKLDPAATLQLQAEVREVLLQRALLERGAIEAVLDKNARVQLELQAARRFVLAKAYSRHLSDPRRVADKDVTAEYERVKTDLADVEYQIRRLSFVEKFKAEQAIKALSENKDFEAVMQFAVPSGEPTPGEWRWIASKRLPEPVRMEIERLSQSRTLEPQPTLVEGTWYVLQVQAQRPVGLPEKSGSEEEIRAKLAQSTIQSWLSQRKKAEGLDKPDENHSKRQ